MHYHLPSTMINRPLKAVVLGAGGTGGEVLHGLHRLHMGLCALGGHGLQVSVFDPAEFRAANLGRQRCLPGEVGQNKALTLVHRLNLAHGLAWEAYPCSIDSGQVMDMAPDLVVGCVDKASVRRDLANAFDNDQIALDGDIDPMLWLDFGNGRHQGQVILGELLPSDNNDFRLPHVVDLFPALQNAESFDSDDTPSCSLAEAIGPGGQDLFINSTLANHGLNLLWQLLTTGCLETHGVFVDLLKMETVPLPIDPLGWEFYGYADHEAKTFSHPGSS